MKVILIVIVILLANARVANEPVILECTTDLDCAIKNPHICGGPYEKEC